MGRYPHLLLIVVFLMAPAGAACNRSVPTTEIPPRATNDTTLGPGDVFTVRVYGEESLSGDHKVSADGSISFPLLGSVKVSGMEPEQVADVLEQQLRDRDILKEPHVSVYVDAYSSKRVSVMGAVANPGTFVLEPGMTVVQAISMAGGFSALADRDATVVTRHVGEETVRYRVPVDRVSKGQANDVEVAAGDIIFVPERMF